MTLAVVIVFSGLGSGSVRAGELAGAQLDAGFAVYDGFHGYQNIRTDPATVSGVGYVHPAGIDLAVSDFITLGTANGLGASGPAGTCPNDYDAKWSIYYDWMIGGIYGCATVANDVYSAGAQPTWWIQYTWCTSQMANRWVLTFAGIVRGCIQHDAPAARVLSAGLETTGVSNTDRNIDVAYHHVYRHLRGASAWDTFGSGAPYHDPNYSYLYVNSTEFRAYLAPWN
jgi:hypothetical protein